MTNAWKLGEQVNKKPWSHEITGSPNTAERSFGRTSQPIKSSSTRPERRDQIQS